jgi:acetyltransferase
VVPVDIEHAERTVRRRSTADERSMVNRPQAKHPLWRFFYPESIAVVGASANPGKLGYALLANVLASGYRGRVIPVNPGAAEILGLPCVRDVADLPQDIDLAIVILPAAKVIDVLKALAARNVRGVVVPVGGFAETGADGAASQAEMRRIARETGMRILGPNVPGFINADAGLNATFAGGPTGTGKLAILSQAGSVAYLMLRNFLAEGIPFGRFICFGNQADISETDLLEFLGADSGVGAICTYVESVRDGARFLDVAARITPAKPILAVKGGRSVAGHGAIFSHTASISSPERIYRAAFQRAGVVWVDSLRALGTVAFALARQGGARGRRVGIVTSLAGVGVIAADACERAGLDVVEPSSALRAQLAALIPAMGSTRNPIDLTGDVNPAMLAACLDVMARSDELDCILPLVMGVPGSREFGNAAYEAASKPALERAIANGKAVALQWVMDEAGGEEIAAVRAAFHPLGIPVCLYPEDAVDVLRGLVAYGGVRARKAAPVAPPSPTERAAVRDAASPGRSVLTEHEGKLMLAAAGIPVVPSRLATSADQAEAAAAEIGYPVVLKLQSPDATHKSDLGGVALNLPDASAVRAAFGRMTEAFRTHAPDGAFDGVSVQPMIRERGIELVCGVAADAQFGKYLMIGLGGVAVEILEDVSLRLLPVGEDDVREMLTELKAYKLLCGHRGAPAVDLAALIRFIVAVARLAAAPEIVEIEINPVLATPAGAKAMDARGLLRSAAGIV